MVPYPNQVALALSSFTLSVPHVGDCIGIDDLTSRGISGDRKVTAKKELDEL